MNILRHITILLSNKVSYVGGRALCRRQFFTNLIIYFRFYFLVGVLPMKLLIITMLLVLSGCASYATSSAPASDGKSIYVTGSYQNKAEVWKCPKDVSGAECVRIDVTEK
jgi:hypothetical protein